MIRYLTPILLVLSIIQSGIGQTQDVRLFIFGHSLINHEPPAIAVPSNETTVPHWIYFLAQAEGNTLAAGGQYGFLPQHQRTPPISQWGYDNVPGVWESDTEPFSAANVNTVMITAGNFVQYQGSDQEYDADPGVTPQSATVDVFDWVDDQRDAEVRYYIYENWPDMAGFLNNGFPPSLSEWTNYNEELNNSFHDWWIEYHDAVMTQRPDYNIRMIPVGQAISDVLLNTLNNSIPITELYEDDAPHGRASIYFLAGLVSYMAIYQQPAPANYVVPDIVHADIRNNYTTIAADMWEYLLDFDTPAGDSRVFFDATTSSDDPITLRDDITISPNPSSGIFWVKAAIGSEIRVYNTLGQAVQTHTLTNDYNTTIDLSHSTTGPYIIQIMDSASSQLTSKKVITIR